MAPEIAAEMNLGCDCVWVGVSERRGGNGSGVVPKHKTAKKKNYIFIDLLFLIMKLENTYGT